MFWLISIIDLANSGYINIQSAIQSPTVEAVKATILTTLFTQF